MEKIIVGWYLEYTLKYTKYTKILTTFVKKPFFSSLT